VISAAERSQLQRLVLDLEISALERGTDSRNQAKIEANEKAAQAVREYLDSITAERVT
jgi:hypothetical protein